MSTPEAGAAAQADAALLAAHVAGDPEAFGLLFARHRDRLWAVALRTAGNPEDAADALQDAMISAFRRADGFRGQSSVTTWLHRIVVNACLDRLRHLKVRAADPLPDDLDRAAGSGPTGGGRDRSAPADPAELVVVGEQRRTLLRALAALPPEHRAALVLVDMEGFTVAEAAEVLGCPVGTVKSRCSRGRAKLAAVLRPPPSSLPAQPPPRPPEPEPLVGNPAAAAYVPSPEQEGGVSERRP
ncbi:RNA polymerase sigma factor SigM [Nocardioides gilvus]|uniref:RNA polymerase sigma factor SigM n=1 Tax=Nocardioides gilvus TaxID=1735589 RepID=UPI000D74BF1C|nr:RNA polymerase sigma factor SigM [Nocardioides gilvus]